MHCGGRIQVSGLSWFSIIIFNSRFWSYSIHALTSTFRAYLRDSLLVRALSLPLILLTSRLHVMWKSTTAWTLVKLYWQSWFVSSACTLDHIWLKWSSYLAFHSLSMIICILYIIAKVFSKTGDSFGGCITNRGIIQPLKENLVETSRFLKKTKC